MTSQTELWVNREQLRETRLTRQEPAPLASGQIRVAIDKYGLTANNVSYAVAGDAIGYWKFYPAPEPWGIVPVWGLADVVASECPEIAVGERLWGFFPMASHTLLTPGKVTDDFFMEASPHRQELAAVYNQYRRVAAEPEVLQQMEDERCLYFPLFITSYVLYDFFTDNDYFGAQQLLIGSVSSKTGLGLAQLVHQDQANSRPVIGFTGAANVEFVKGLGCCDQLLVYGEEDAIDTQLKTAYVDMSGNGALTESLHRLLGENMVASCMVGATHWESARPGGELPGAPPTFFFAPAQIAKRDQEWGPGVLFGKASQASVMLIRSVQDAIATEYHRGPKAASAIWLDLLGQKVAPSRGLMVSMQEQAHD